MDEYKQKIGVLEAEIRLLTERKISLQEEIEVAFQDERKRLDSTAKKAKESLDEANRMKSAIAVTKQEYDKLKEALEDSFQDLRKKQDEFKTECLSKQKEFDNGRDELNRKMADLGDQNKALAAQEKDQVYVARKLKEREDVIAKSANHIKYELENLQSLQSEIINKQDKIKSLQESIAKERKDVEDKEGVLNAREMALNNAWTQLNAFKKEWEGKLGKYDDNVTDLMLLKNHLQQQEDRLKAKEKELKNKEQKLNELQKSLIKEG